MTPDFKSMNMYERAKARREFVRANRHRMTNQELAIAIGTGTDNVRAIFRALDGEGNPPPKKERGQHSGYATWACHKKRPALLDNFGGCF